MLQKGELKAQVNIDLAQLTPRPGFEARWPRRQAERWAFLAAVSQSAQTNGL